MNFLFKIIDRQFWKRHGIPLALALVLPGCGKEEIQVFEVSKGKTDGSAMANPHGSGMPGANPQSAAEARDRLAWQLPTGWTEQAPSSMRVASFAVSDANGQTAEVAAIPLPGVTGRDLDMVNMWRSQVRLEPIQPGEMDRLMTKVTVASAEGRLFDMAGTTPPEGAKFPLRVLVAILDREGTAWFFKMTGDDQLVSEQKPAFVDFLKSLQFVTAQAQPALPPSHPPVEGLTTQPSAVAENGSKPTWEVPAGWKEEPPAQMLVAKFSATDNAVRAEITVSSFPGDVGGLLANVNRWRGQVSLPPIDEASLEQAVTQVDVQVGKGSLVELNGTIAKTGQKARLVGVAVPHGGATWFCKMLGDEQIVAKEKAAFLKFVQSVKYPHAP